MKVRAEYDMSSWLGEIQCWIKLRAKTKYGIFLFSTDIRKTGRIKRRNDSDCNNSSLTPASFAVLFSHPLPLLCPFPTTDNWNMCIYVKMHAIICAGICMREWQHIHKHTNVEKHTNLGTHRHKQNPPFNTAKTKKINHINFFFFFTFHSIWWMHKAWNTGS